MFELDTGKNGGNQSLRTLDVVPDTEVDMDYRKDQEPPHDKMVCETGPLLGAEHRDAPSLPE